LRNLPPFSECGRHRQPGMIVTPLSATTFPIMNSRSVLVAGARQAATCVATANVMEHKPIRENPVDARQTTRDRGTRERVPRLSLRSTPRPEASFGRIVQPTEPRTLRTALIDTPSFTTGRLSRKVPRSRGLVHDPESTERKCGNLNVTPMLLSGDTDVRKPINGSEWFFAVCRFVVECVIHRMVGGEGGNRPSMEVTHVFVEIMAARSRDLKGFDTILCYVSIGEFSEGPASER